MLLRTEVPTAAPQSKVPGSAALPELHADMAKPDAEMAEQGPACRGS